ncbi:MerR family transcriptional regulator [Mycetocola tolaasinivorans]|uniref:MerR family transcriptional regulator n=1 Tax=Mycetocola tolaasinivorans TaxID=76635 RepID=A0A3L7ADQ9_9MICO|nr:MerR family transcriptional regulator [Mycetocola tolaasinivorans]RLP78125.1 MerR family transcriptional regulator [Mycetocola tolaasinivorans]
MGARGRTAPGAGSSARAATLLSIGQVLARLSGDFPDLSNSKLRFLEEQGLVSPERTRSGYRKFSPADVERLRLILSLQRDHYLPLKVIRGYLRDMDNGITPMLPGGAGSILQGSRRLTREELLRSTGASPALLTEAVSAGLIPAGEGYPDGAATMLTTLMQLHQRGIEPRHLRGFHAQIEREVGLIERAVSSLAARPDTASRAQAAEQAGEIAEGFDRVRAVLLRAALDRLQP